VRELPQIERSPRIGGIGDDAAYGAVYPMGSPPADRAGRIIRYPHAVAPASAGRRPSWVSPCRHSQDTNMAVRELLLERHGLECWALDAQPVTPDIGRPFYRALTTLDALALVDEPPSTGAEGGSNSLQRWRRRESNPGPRSRKRWRLRA
jgi:hypothetical protein